MVMSTYHDCKQGGDIEKVLKQAGQLVSSIHLT